MKLQIISVDVKNHDMFSSLPDVQTFFAEPLLWLWIYVKVLLFLGFHVYYCQEFVLKCIYFIRVSSLFHLLLCIVVFLVL